MNLERARFNMVEQQVRPWDVLDQQVLDSLAHIPREIFVPAQHRGIAFSDAEISLTPGGSARGEVIFPPKLDARVIQSLQLRKTDRVLEIGTGSGYMAALMARQTASVVSYELNKALASQAVTNLEASGIHNVEVVAEPASPASLNASFDVIVFSGSIGELPESWFLQLAPTARVAAYVGKEPAMQCRVYECHPGSAPTMSVLFETVVARLQGFPEPDRFSF